MWTHLFFFSCLSTTGGWRSPAIFFIIVCHSHGQEESNYISFIEFNSLAVCRQQSSIRNLYTCMHTQWHTPKHNNFSSFSNSLCFIRPAAAIDVGDYTIARSARRPSHLEYMSCLYHSYNCSTSHLPMNDSDVIVWKRCDSISSVPYLCLCMIQVWQSTNSIVNQRLTFSSRREYSSILITIDENLL